MDMDVCWEKIKKIVPNTVAAAPMSNGACEPPKKIERENNVE